MRRHRKLLLGVVAGAAALGGGCTTPATAPAQAAADPQIGTPEAPMVEPAAAPPDAGPKPCTWKAGNYKTPPCTD